MSVKKHDQDGSQLMPPVKSRRKIEVLQKLNDCAGTEKPGVNLEGFQPS